MTESTVEKLPYQHFTLKMAWELAAPHTWPASILPVLIALCCACAIEPLHSFSVVMVCVLLAIAVLMQAAVNTFNDYYDYVKGSDSAEDNVEESDAVLVYNHVNPRSALFLAIGFLLAAFLLGIYVIVCAGFIPLIIALIGAAFVVLYSAGKTPVSYLPVGEVVSGVVMGGLIMLASYTSLTQSFSWWALLWAIPPIIGIGLIMMTNNTCDIEKDIVAGRRTLPVLLGRERAKSLYHAFVFIWIAAIIVLWALFFLPGCIIAPFMVLTCIPLLRAILSNPLVNPSRVAAMSQILSLNIAFGVFYCAGILASQILLAI